MKKYYVNIKQEKIFVAEIWAESKEVAVFKANKLAEKREDEWRDGRKIAYVKPVPKWS